LCRALLVFLIISLSPVISDLLRHPVPPQVVRRILRPQDDLDLPGADVVSINELTKAFEAVLEMGDSAQMFTTVINRHTERLNAADTEVNKVADMLLEFHTMVEGDLPRVGLLLADLAPAPHTGAPITREMARALLQCHSGTRCTFQGLLQCLKRFRDKQHEEDGLAKTIAAHLLPIADRPVLVGLAEPAKLPGQDTPISSPSCRAWRETLRGWLMDKEAFEAVPHIESPWEDSDSSNPSRSWTALMDFFQALQGNVTNWIRKMELNSMYTLAAHGEDLFGPDGAHAKSREERRLDLKLNKDAWKLLSGREQEDWITHLITNGAQQIRRLNPCIISWNAGPHGYRTSRDEIWSLFAKGQPIICLQDLRIPRKMIPAIKDELHVQFPNYWIFMSTVSEQDSLYNSTGGQYHFTTLTALDSYNFPSASSVALHPGSQKGRGQGACPVVSGRALALSTTTKSGGKFTIINLYQFTAAKPAAREEVWDIIAKWIRRHSKDKVILIGDLNSAPVHGRQGYSLPLSGDIRKADEGLLDFCQGTTSTLVSVRDHSWKRGKQSAALDNAVTWNYHLAGAQVCHVVARHKQYDHGVLSIELPLADFATSYKVPKRNFDIPTDRVDVVFFQRSLLQWHKNAQRRISPFAQPDKEETGESLFDKLREEQGIMREEALKLQGKSEAGRRRARERRPDRSKAQVHIRRLQASLAVAYSEALQATEDSPVTAATRIGLKTLGLDHLPEVLFKHIRASPNWAYLLRAEIKKLQAKRLKLDETHLREGKRRRNDAKKYIFDHGIKGVRRVMRKHGTITHLQQVDQSCPTGLQWDISPTEAERSGLQAEVEEWMSSLPPENYVTTHTEHDVTVKAKLLSDVPALLAWSAQHPSGFEAQPVLMYSTGPWSKENLVTAVEYFFQQNAYHPFAHCSHPQKHEEPVPLTEILPPSKETGKTERKMLHFCSHPDCADLDPGKFRSNRKEVKDMSFFDRAKAFSYRTIDPKETIRGRIKTFREFSLFVARMANRKACGDDKMPADLFKNAPEAF